MTLEEIYYDFVKEAQALSDSKQYDKAETLLREYVNKMPDDWRPFVEEPEFDKRYFWNQSEFISFCRYSRSNLDKSCKWVFPSYSKAHYLLAYILIEKGNFDEALDELDKGLELEPDHPRLLCEKGYILGRFGNREATLSLYRQAANSRPWNTVIQKTGALREEAVVLVDMRRYDEAEAAINQAIELNPEDESLKQELDYIRQLQDRDR